MSDQACGQCFTHHPDSLCPDPARRLDPTLGPPEESLCGEEEALAAGLYEEVFADVPPPPPGSDKNLQAWAEHCRTAGRSRTRAYAEALSLTQAQFEAWRQVFPGVADAAFVAQGREPLSSREKEVLAYYAAGFAAFLRDTLAVAERGGR